MSIEVLKNQLKNKTPGKLYLFYGPEEYLKQYYLESLEKQVLQGAADDLNKQVLDGKLQMNALTNALETYPFFSEKKLIVLKNTGAFKSKKKQDDSGEGEKTQNTELLACLKNVPEYACVVFMEQEINKTLKTVKAVAECGLVVEFPAQKAPDLVKWVQKVMKSSGKEIHETTAAYLVERSEPAMNDLLNEINKLVLYTADRSMVTTADVDKICTRSLKSRIFDLTDAIAAKNPGKALKILDELITLKEPVPKIFYMIGRHFRQVLEVKLLAGQGMGSAQVAAKMNSTPYVAGKLLQQARGMKEKTLQEAVYTCLEYDAAVKTGRLGDRIAAELLITRYGTGEEK